MNDGRETRGTSTLRSRLSYPLIELGRGVFILAVLLCVGILTIGAVGLKLLGVPLGEPWELPDKYHPCGQRR